MTIEIVDFPINSMVIFHSYVKLPEGNHGWYGLPLMMILDGILMGYEWLIMINPA